MADGHGNLDDPEGVGVTVRARTLRRWLRRIGFSWRKDRYVPYRSVSKERQEEFKREPGSARPRGARTA